MAQEQRIAVIRFIVDKIKDVGKIKIQKLIYFLQMVFEVPFGYDYKMHYYGPYSEELNDDLVVMQVNNIVNVEADPAGYGYHIMPGSEKTTAMNEVLEKYSNSISKCLDSLKSFSPSQLEILGTLHFVNNVAGVSDEEKIIEKTAMLKPLFSKSSIEEMYNELKKLK